MGEPPEPVHQRWIHRDTPRGLVATGLCAVTAVVYAVIAVGVFDADYDPVIVTFLAWDVYALADIVLRVRAYAGTSPADLPALVRRTSTPSRFSRLFTTTEGPDAAVSLASVALVAAALLPQLDVGTSADRFGRGAVIISAVVLSWVVVVVSFAVYYARTDIEHGGLQFPDQEPRHAWVDYLYFSLSVSATFGTTDVSVTSSRLRRAVLTHTAIGFVFNTVIIALLVSALST